MRHGSFSKVRNRRGCMPYRIWHKGISHKRHKKHKNGDRLLCLLCLLWLIPCSCTQQMADQPSYALLQASDFFANGSSARLLPVGVIPHDYVTKDDLLDTGMIN